MSKLANELTLIRHMIEVGYRRKHAKNHIPSLVSRVSSGDQTLENNKTLALRARVSYRFLVFGSPDETLKLVVYI